MFTWVYTSLIVPFSPFCCSNLCLSNSFKHSSFGDFQPQQFYHRFFSLLKKYSAYLKNILQPMLNDPVFRHIILPWFKIHWKLHSVPKIIQQNLCFQGLSCGLKLCFPTVTTVLLISWKKVLSSCRPMGIGFAATHEQPFTTVSWKFPGSIATTLAKRHARNSCVTERSETRL